MIGDAQTIKKWLSKKNREIIMKYLYNDIRYAIPIEEIISIKEIALSKLQQNFSNYVAPQSYIF